MVILGYIGMIVGFGCLGMIRAAQIKRRPQEIRDLINALALLDTEIYWGVVPLPEAFRVLKERTDLPWKSFFAALEAEIMNGTNASAAWEKCIREQRRCSSLLDEDWKVIRSIGQGLGRSDRNEQHKQLELGQRHLQAVDEKARKQADGKAKMWSYLGFLGGMVIVIMII
ncbi:stage III sporulation protein AB [Dehalobacter sp. DCM]|uniref:stage III sporulation protein AB n=1 Tax=Dehalobacter sp. DCM TaxID=2907827 RepID=UPI00308138DF|nr:stage III sporulation protein AB [Dehalobacter sp. DCM]